MHAKEPWRLELNLHEILDVILELSRADGSIGWSAMIGCASPHIFTRLPRATFDTIYSASPDVILAGSTAPTGSAERDDDVYRVSGRWPFASGCHHAHWMFGACSVRTPDAPADAPPQIYVAFLPAREWSIEDTWHVAGLKGTGSNHISIDKASVPTSHTFEATSARTCVAGPLYYSAGIVNLFHAAMAVGVATGALEDLVAMATSGRQQMRARTPMRASPVFKYELGRVEGDVRAATAFLQVQTASAWQRAMTGQLDDARPDPDIMQATLWIIATCARAVDACYTLGGGEALYDASPLQRRWRDIHAATQHVAAQQRNYEIVGAARLRQP